MRNTKKCRTGSDLWTWGEKTKKYENVLIFFFLSNPRVQHRLTSWKRDPWRKGCKGNPKRPEEPAAALEKTICVGFARVAGGGGAVSAAEAGRSRRCPRDPTLRPRPLPAGTARGALGGDRGRPQRGGPGRAEGPRGDARPRSAGGRFPALATVAKGRGRGGARLAPPLSPRLPTSPVVRRAAAARDAAGGGRRRRGSVSPAVSPFSARQTPCWFERKMTGGGCGRGSR